MQDSRIRIRLETPVATPLVSGTLFGQFCWMIRLIKGEQALHGLLAELDASPLIFSDALPAGFVPVPLLVPSRDVRLASPGLDHKRLARRTLLPLETLLSIRRRLDANVLREALAKQREEPALLSHRTAHNQINRLTGTTPSAGGLFFVDESWPAGHAGSEFDIYVRGNYASLEIPAVFEAMGEHGFGKDATTGRGRFRVLVHQPCPELQAVTGNRWVSWSRGVRDSQMSEPRYRLYTHYGKLGNFWATSVTGPFKYPITLWNPGATFAGTAPNLAFGRLLKGVHHERPEIVHNAWHFAVPYQEVQ